MSRSKSAIGQLRNELNKDLFDDVGDGDVDPIYYNNDPIQVCLDLREQHTGSIFGKCDLQQMPANFTRMELIGPGVEIKEIKPPPEILFS